MNTENLIKIYHRAIELEDQIKQFESDWDTKQSSTTRLRLKMMKDTHNLNCQILLKFEAANRLNQDGILLTQ
jgi:hypothetical protein